MELGALSEAIEELSGADPFSYSDPDSVIILERLAARLDCIVTKAVSAFAGSGEWAADEAKGAVPWLATRCLVPKALARSQLRRGRALEHLPHFAAAWGKGAICGAHVDAVSRAQSAVTEDALVRDEPLLVKAAQEMKFASFVSALSYWQQLADPDGAEASDMERRARRDVYLTESVDGMWLGTMTLDPISGAIVSGTLEEIEGELFCADWAAAEEALGRQPKRSDLSRTSAQRHADALVEMATRARVAPIDGRRPEPLFSVLVGYEALYGRLCQLEDGGVLAPGTLLPHLDAATFERAVFAPGKRVEVSVTSRFFTGATRRAIELRDRTCTHPFCDLPADQCQIDHIVPWTAGGLTIQENGRVLCGFHNRLRNGRPPPGR